MAAIDSAYQYYLSTYANNKPTRYDTHKKSQLRDVCQQIAKLNKESPLYKIKNAKHMAKHAIDIKEAAKNLQNVIYSLSDSNGDMKELCSRQVAMSSNEEAVSVEYIGTESADTSGLDLQVQQLAKNQVNRGNPLSPSQLHFSPGTYQFDINTQTHAYEFQYTVSESDTNLSVLQKLAKLIHSADIGIAASVDTNEQGQVSLVLNSKQTGISEDEAQLFELMPATDTGSITALRTLGIEAIQTHAQNAHFLLNGSSRQSSSNSFTVDHRFDLHLHEVTEDEIHIGFKTNIDAITDQIETLALAYNRIIDLGHSNRTGNQSNKLVRDISCVVHEYFNELEAYGIGLDEKSHLTIDRNLLSDAVGGADAPECFQTLKQFKDALLEKTTVAYLDPMHYVDKVVVAYKNPGHNFASAYITSIYSGMMLDQYC